MIYTWWHPDHLSVHVGDSSWCSEEFVKILNCTSQRNYYCFYYFYHSGLLGSTFNDMPSHPWFQSLLCQRILIAERWGEMVNTHTDSLESGRWMFNLISIETFVRATCRALARDGAECRWAFLNAFMSSGGETEISHLVFVFQNDGEGAGSMSKCTRPSRLCLHPLREWSYSASLCFI